MTAQHYSNDSTIFERRLRPIYDDLEVGNNRKALQETERLLRKHPNMSCIKALKGLALMRLGRYEESHESLVAVANEKPVDDPTLQVLSFCYKELEQFEKIVDLYNYAVKQQPTNEELLAHLFMSYVRLEDFKSQQASALQLYKAHPKNAYYFWAVMSVYLQGVRGPEKSIPAKRQIYLSLAQRMIDKMILDNRLESDQELYLYLQILQQQGKHQQALDFIDDCNNGYEKLCLNVPIDFRLRLYKDLCKWSESHSLLKELLTQDSNRWDYYQHYLDICFELLEANGKLKHRNNKQIHHTLDNGNDQEEQDETHETNELEDEKVSKANETKSKYPTQCLILDECHDFFCQLMELSERRVRGPYLARLELHKRMQENQLNALELLGDFESLIIEYFHLFGDKPCCIQDISIYLPHIKPEQRKQLANRLLAETGITATELPQTKEQMQKHICALTLARMCGVHEEMSNEHLYALYTTLKLHYEHGLMHFGQDLLSTDLGPSDPYTLLAANVMYDLSLREQRADRLFEVLCLLQYNLRNSISNFHMKLFCLKIYHMLGCTLGAMEMYDNLDIKQIQMDSMGHVYCSLMTFTGRFTLARVVYDATLKFFTGCFKDRLDYLALTYRFGSFSKVEEFMDFKERITNSYHFAAVSVEAQLCDLVLLNGNIQQNLNTYTMMNIDPAEDRINWSRLRDNRDLNAMICMDSVDVLQLEEDREQSFVQELEVLRIRSLMLRLLAAMIDLYYPLLGSKSMKNNNTTTTTTTSSSSSSRDPALVHNNHQKENDSLGAADTSMVPELRLLETLSKQWSQLYKRITDNLNNYKPLTNRFLVNLLPTRLHLLLRVPYEHFFTCLTELVGQFYWGDQRLPLKCKEMCEMVQHLANLCSETIDECQQLAQDMEDNGLWKRREWQGTVSACIEIMSLYAFILSLIYEKLRSNSNVKTRKKSFGSNENLVSEKERCLMLLELMRHLKKELQRCDNIINKWDAPNLPSDLGSYMSDMSLNPELETGLISDVSCSFKLSHKNLLSELHNLIKDKMRMVGK